MNGGATFLAGMTLALAGGWFLVPETLYRSGSQPLQFNHRLHVSEDVGLTCDNCHAFDADGRFAGIPRTAACAECHAEPVGDTENEKTLVDAYVTPGREIPWLVYARQPDNVFFSHIQHVNAAGLACADCHGPHGESDHLRPYRVNRLSGYSRDLSARSLGGFRNGAAYGLRMDDCLRCHRARGASESCLTCHK